MEKQFLKKIICIMLVILLLSACGQTSQKIAPVSVQKETIDETIRIFALGDNLLHMPVVNSGKNEDGSYSYGHLFDKLQPTIKEADLAVIGQETVFGGEAFGYSGYPLFNSPSDMGKTLVEEGFDVVLHASNHILDKGVAGIMNTLDFWSQYPNVHVLGINRSAEEKEKICLTRIKGADIALLNYTYGTNGITLPQDKAYLVNYIDREKIMKDAQAAEEVADFTIAFMHWGTEYATKPDEMQKELARKMCTWGVDLIIGSHPHVIEPVEWIETENGNKMLVYYSLGNFVSRQKEARNLLGGAADVTLHFDGEKVSIKEHVFLPIVTHYNATSTDFDVYPLSTYTDELAALHGITPYDGAVSVARWETLLASVFEGYDTAILQ